MSILTWGKLATQQIKDFAYKNTNPMADQSQPSQKQNKMTDNTLSNPVVNHYQGRLRNT